VAAFAEFGVKSDSRFWGFAFLCVLLGAGCDRGADEPMRPVEETPRHILQKFSTRHTEAGVTRWALIADSAEFHQSVGYVVNPTVQIFEDGKQVVTITGTRGEIIQASNDISIFGNVVAASKDGELYTDELHWKNREGKVYGPNECKIVRGGSTMIGRKMEGNPSLEVVTMKNIRFQIYPKDEKIDATPK
jgi:LPS export ABC transporter protein LptC